jgi:ribosomal-protein-serine acetyltransferase
MSPRSLAAEGCIEPMFTRELRPGVALALLEAAHAPELFLLTDSNREHLRRWLPWLDRVRSVEDTRKFIAAARQQLADDDGFQSAILVDGQIAGLIGHHSIDRLNRATQLGYWLAESQQGKGIMSEACRALVGHAFAGLGLERVEIRCARANQRSRAIPERLGFTREGVLRRGEWLYDHFVDLVVYSALRDEWAGGLDVPNAGSRRGTAKQGAARSSAASKEGAAAKERKGTR